VQRVLWRKHLVDAIEEVLHVAFVMYDPELRRIKKTAGIKSVGRDESPQFLPPYEKFMSTLELPNEANRYCGTRKA